MTLISKRMQLNTSKDGSLEGRQSRLKITPSAGSSFTSNGGNFELKLPTVARGHLDTNAYLKFSVTSNDSNPGLLDTNAHSFFL
jgi:hypothetical protein